MKTVFPLCTALGTLIGVALVPGPSWGQGPPPAEKTPARTFPELDRFGDPLPGGALARLGTERFRHRYPGYVFYSPDGKIVASITHLRYADVPEGQFATLWDAATGKKLLDIPDVDSLVFAPDSKAVAVVRAFKLSPQTLAVGRADEPIRVVEIPSGREKFRLPLHACHPFAFSPQGDLVTAGRDDRIHSWTGSEGTLLKVIPSEGKELNVLGVSVDGKEVSSVDDAFVLRVYDRSSGNKVRQVAMGAPGKENRREVFDPKSLITPDGRYYCDAGYAYVRLTENSSGRKNTLRVWDIATGKEVAHLPGVKRPLPRSGNESEFGIFGIALSTDGKTLAYAQSYNVTTIVDVATGKARDLKRLEGMEDLGVALSPDGKTLATAGGHCHVVRFWDLQTGKEKVDPTVHAGPVFSLAVSPDERLIATGGRDYTIKLWDRATGEYLHTFRGPDSDVGGLCFSLDGKRLASVCHDGAVYVWNPGSRTEERQLSKKGGFGAAWVISVSPAGDTVTAILPEVVTEPDPLKRELLTRRAKGVLHVWRVDTGKEKVTRPLDYHAFGTQTAASRDGQWLAFGSGKAITLCSATTAENWKIEDSHLTRVNRVAFSHDGKTLAANDRSEIHLFSTATRKHLRTIQRPGMNVQDFAFSPDGRYLIGTYLDLKNLATKFQLWELASESPALAFESPFHYDSALAFAADGKTLFSAGGPTSAYIWGLEPASWRKAPPTSFDDKRLTQAWADLAALDAAAGYEAVWLLAGAGNKAVHFLKKLLTPAVAFSEPAYARLLGDLDGDDFEARTAAMAELRRLGPSVEVELRRSAAKPASLEAGRRLKTLLDELDEPIRAPAALRLVRAVEVLERIATPEGRQLLKELAGGLSEARFTREALQAIRRLGGKATTN